MNWWEIHPPRQPVPYATMTRCRCDRIAHLQKLQEISASDYIFQWLFDAATGGMIGEDVIQATKAEVLLRCNLAPAKDTTRHDNGSNTRPKWSWSISKPVWSISLHLISFHFISFKWEWGSKTWDDDRTVAREERKGRGCRQTTTDSQREEEYTNPRRPGENQQ